MVQATTGEPAGQLRVEGASANVLMFNVSPVLGLRQTREGRSFMSHMQHGDMTLMPSGVPSDWSWNSTCDRLDVILSADVLGEGNRFDVVDRFLFRDPEVEAICRQLYREVSVEEMADLLRVESLVMELAHALRRRHSTASEAVKTLRSSRLTRNQARHVLDYIESQLSRELTLRELADVADLSLHHFARMFKQTIGLAPHRYVLERRVENAKIMLRSADASLADISLSTGFCNQSHFTSTFSRMAGVTPSEFQGRSRKRHHGRPSPKKLRQR
jgi:AraC family transcriptional regulator